MERAKTQRSSLTPKQGSKDTPILSPLTFGDFSSSTLQSLSADESFFSPSQTVENAAILRACLNTGLVKRASKIFDRMREEAIVRSQTYGNPAMSTIAFEGPLDKSIYNAMIAAYLRKAAHEESRSESSRWIRKAWNVFEEMDMYGTQEYDSEHTLMPDAVTYANISKGIVNLMRLQRYPSEEKSLAHLLSSLRRSRVSAQDIFLSSAFTHESSDLENIASSHLRHEGEPEARMVLMHLSTSAADMADNVMLSELDGVNRMLSGLEKEAMEDVQSDEDAVSLQGQVEPLRPVLSTRKKSEKSGDGSPEVAFNLKVLQENLSAVEDAKRVSSDPFERQKILEFGALNAARERFKHSSSHLEEIGLKNAGKLQDKQLQKWMWDWYCKLEQALAKDIARIRKAEETQKERGATGRSMEAEMLPLLQLLPASKLALITILELMRMQGTGAVTEGMKTASALVSVGRYIESECYADMLRKNENSFNDAKNITLNLKKRGLSDMQVRRELKALHDKQAERIGSGKVSWTNSLRVRIGSYVVQHLMNVATVYRSAVDRDGERWDEEQPAFYSTYQYIQGKRLGVIKLNDIVAQQLGRDSAIETLHPRHLPMLVPPKPWLSYDSGGYYSAKSKALRYKDDVEQGSYLRAASEDGSLEIVLAGLDVLGSTAWSINGEVFEVMAKVWNMGTDLADMPPAEPVDTEPERPNNYDTDIKARGIYLKRLKHYNLKRAAIYSRRCDINYKLEIANAYLGERFYFPHNMDFRGRAYPIPPHLNHIGNDLCRGLLKFADRKPLGEVGLRWLRIHCANVYGYDKASFAEREQFAIDNESHIRDSVRDPLGEGNWWLNADDPWQTLAACFELVQALDHPEGPEKYQSNLPVHQDGTCNGLQHYAALGGDLVGAKQVNLSGGDRPADVYSGVADLVIDVIDRHAAEGDEVAKMLQGKITRKVVKQTVMTTVYGVTFIGAKEQVSRQLNDLNSIPVEDVWRCASYLASRIMECIGDLFKGAQAIQEWLSESALLIAKSIPPERLEEALQGSTRKNGRSLLSPSKLAQEQMTSVIWTTPLGLPVVQPYRKLIRKQLATTMQTVFLHDPHVATQVAPSKQASAFPPNFIHSLDATHMFLTALECQNANLTFASVHDSYWTHACDIETMSDIIRDTFVRLHSCDILQRLYEEVCWNICFSYSFSHICQFLERYKGHRVPVKTIRNTLRRRASRQASRGNDNVVVEVTPEGKLRSRIAQEDGDGEKEAACRSDAEPAAEGTRDLSTAEGLSSPNKNELIDAHFVDLAQVLPPIPKKGSFDVNEIKVCVLHSYPVRITNLRSFSSALCISSHNT